MKSLSEYLSILRSLLNFKLDKSPESTVSVFELPCPTRAVVGVIFLRTAALASIGTITGKVVSYDMAREIS